MCKIERTGMWINARGEIRTQDFRAEEPGIRVKIGRDLKVKHLRDVVGSHWSGGLEYEQKSVEI